MEPDRTTQPVTAAPFAPGSRWLHVWADTVPGSDLTCVAIQVEVVGIRITAAPYVLCTPGETRKILALFAQLKGAVCEEAKRSIPLDEQP